eukprot:CAMPEP_0119517258 /NCGR_PEP_ID=MMETSP1344-20130328/34204_1 /TAXON_ID=236787 /ORGANISM="Florenciella parvula, Strain CCMP2471" /LENGTH=71 /DNA_ID=CAMNT_0007554831 /DNA_START=16 /DNA_END=227 /DNA_ORIENTATION=-
MSLLRLIATKNTKVRAQARAPDTGGGGGGVDGATKGGAVNAGPSTPCPGLDPPPTPCPSLDPPARPMARSG